VAHRSAGVAAVVIPAVLAAGAVLLLDRGADSAPPSSEAELSRLARRAENLSALQSALTPLELRPARGGAPQADLGARVRPARPVRISIPGARVKSPVVPARVKRGAIEIPSVGKAGWYSGGPRPGEPGRAVIIGHLDRRHGPGLFARVPKLDRGAVVTVTDTRREVHRYRVVGAGQARKNRFPRDQVLGYSARPVLVLVTCGGPFRPGRGYRDNVLVFARGAG
jgi:sortase (surface protein transpeptidase)